MKGFDRLHIKSAVKAHSPMQLDKTHLTTMDFGQIMPLYTKELIPGDKWSVQANYFSRLAPLVKPTYGKFSFKTASFFVPYYQLADDAEAFISGQTMFEGTTPYLRYILYKDYVAFLKAIGTVVGTGSSALSDDTEWIMTNGNGDVTGYKFVGVSKYYLKVLNALGYSLPQSVSEVSGSGWWTNFASKRMSAMPLLAFAKAYNDYMSQSQRYNSSDLTYLLRVVRQNTAHPQVAYQPATHSLTSTGLLLIFDNIKLCFENDYFTSAWQNPSQPLNNFDQITQVNAPYSNGSNPALVTAGANNTYLPGNMSTISQRALDFLKSFDDWVRRNNYSGSRIVQKIYSRFGIKTEDYRSNYAHCIGTSQQSIQVGDVTATSSANVNIDGNDYTNVVGDYAGKGIMNSGDNISYQSSDYGLLLILGYYTVYPMMGYGFDRSVLRVEPFDFYTPEYDGLGADAISFGEVFPNAIALPSQDPTLDNVVFGFTERYNDMRYERDLITGEFRNFHKGADSNVWHSGRLLNSERENYYMIAQSSQMNTLPQCNSEFNRIFSVVDGANDHFYMTAQFNVSAVRPMLSLNQVPKLGEGDTNIEKNGNTIN